MPATFRHLWHFNRVNDLKQFAIHRNTLKCGHTHTVIRFLLVKWCASNVNIPLTVESFKWPINSMNLWVKVYKNGFRIAFIFFSFLPFIFIFGSLLLLLSPLLFLLIVHTPCIWALCLQAIEIKMMVHLCAFDAHSLTHTHICGKRIHFHVSH